MENLITNQKKYDLVKKEFNQLKKYLGKEVVMTVITKSGSFKREGSLQFVDDFLFFGIEGGNQAVIGLYNGVSEVMSEGVLLYKNEYIDYTSLKNIGDISSNIKKHEDHTNSIREKKYGTTKYNID